MKAQLFLVQGEAHPPVLTVNPGDVITIGRSRECSVVIRADDLISRLHARVYFEGENWYIRDLGLNGTRIDNVRIKECVQLYHGDEIGLGAATFRFALDQPDDPPSIDNLSHIDSSITHSAISQSTSMNTVMLSHTDLNSVHQLLVTALETNNVETVVRQALQTLHYHTKAYAVGLYNLNQHLPLAKFLWPQTATIDESLSRQLCRRVAREQRTVLSSDDTGVTMAGSDLLNTTRIQDAVCIPLKSNRESHEAIHLYSMEASFSDDDIRFAEIIAQHLGMILQQMRGQKSLAAEVMRLKSGGGFRDEFLGNSPKVIELRQQIQKFSKNSKPVLVRGQTGSGHEAAALDIHRKSNRFDMPFMVLRTKVTPQELLATELMGYYREAISGAQNDHPGMLSQADEGTVFIEDICDLPADLQVRVLEFMKTGRFRPFGAFLDHFSDVRLMVGLSVPVDEAINKMGVLPEIIHALERQQLLLPTLQERSDDISMLVQLELDRFANDTNQDCYITPDALDQLHQMSWPGNIHELMAKVKALAVLAEDGEINQELIVKMLQPGLAETPSHVG
ncbi:MAG: sigma 54-interacting transcriptional regulator [Zavarzinella sp.]